jgi:F-type H+-transporting ATPase subunit a
MTPLFCSLFFFILAMNLIGLVPCFAAATANVSVTAPLALVTLSCMIFGAIYRLGLGGFVKSFIPPGVPWPVLIVLIPVEFAGVFIKAFALTIRLFANILAGHVVILFLLGLLVAFGLLALPFGLMAVMIYVLEIAVAFLQAYIFTLLSAVFIGERFHPQH